jgi:hypothetical protein
MLTAPFDRIAAVGRSRYPPSGFSYEVGRGRVQVPYKREAEIVLAMWREAEAELRRAPAGSAEEEFLRGEAARFRDEYQRLIREAEKHHRPVPPPFPGTSDEIPDEITH